MAYGFTIERGSGDAADPHYDMSEHDRSLYHQHRTFRVQTTWAVTEGKWYYELELLSEGSVRCGWIRADAAPGLLLGDNNSSYAFDCCSVSAFPSMMRIHNF